MNPTEQICNRAEAMLENPFDLPAIVAQVAADPKFIAKLHSELMGTQSRALKLILEAAAIQAAKAEMDFDRWLQAQDARLEAELDEAFADKTEWEEAA